MSRAQADSLYKDGLTALSKNANPEAAACFRRALELESELGAPSPRTLSYFGVSLARAGISFDVAIDAAKRAAYRSEKDPLLYLNLGRVYQAAGKRICAIKAFEKGLKICPTSGVLRRELDRLDRRGLPVIRGLSRDHAVNRMLGRVRARVRSRRSRATATARA